MSEDLSENEALQKKYIEAIASCLQEIGYKAKIDQDYVIRSAAGGYTVIVAPKIDIALPGSGNIQFHCGVSKEGTNVDLDDVNRYNRRLRFCKMFLDEDKDIVVQADFFFDAFAEDAARRLESLMLIVETSVNELRQTMAASVSENDSEKG